MSRSYRLDRVFPAVGRIHRASGTSRRSVYRQVDAMLSALYSTARLDLLRGIRDGSLHPMQVFDAYRRGRLDELPTAEGLRDLEQTFTAWVKAGAWSAWWRSGLTQAGKRLGSGSVADVPAKLIALRQAMATKARTFNQTRVGALSFCRDTLGRGAAIYLAVRAIPPLPVKVKQPHRPQTPQALTEAPLDAETLAAAWSMAVTGMGPKEFWEDGWEQGVGYIHVHGQKRGGRDRKVPDVGLCKTPTLTRSAFCQRVKRANVAWTPYDLRRSFATWIEAAGIPRTRRKLYLGHGVRDVTDLYEWHEVAAFLRADAQTLRAWVAESVPTSVPHPIAETASSPNG